MELKQTERCRKASINQKHIKFWWRQRADRPGPAPLAPIGGLLGGGRGHIYTPPRRAESVCRHESRSVFGQRTKFGKRRGWNDGREFRRGKRRRCRAEVRWASLRRVCNTQDLAKGRKVPQELKSTLWILRGLSLDTPPNPAQSKAASSRQLLGNVVF